MQVGFKYRWCKGFARLYEYSYRYAHMITKSAQKRYDILCFWKKHGIQAATDAYGAKRSTLYYWNKLYDDGNKKIEALNPKSTAPHNRRKRQIDCQIVEEIRRLRLNVCPNLGKDKIKPFLDEFCCQHGLKVISVSTIGRIIKDKNIYHRHRRVYCTGKVKEFKRLPKKRIPKGFKALQIGDLIELDTIVKFTHGVKRYIITAVDTYTRYSFALAYRRADSQNAKDFFQKLETVFPYPIKRIQTDNGSEFHQHFRDYLDKQTITVHYFNYPRRPYKQGHIERYNRSLQEEFIDRNSYKLIEVSQFNRELMDYLIWYNTKRPHWSLNLKSPVDYLIQNNCLSKMRWTDTNSCHNF